MYRGRVSQAEERPVQRPCGRSMVGRVSDRQETSVDGEEGPRGWGGDDELREKREAGVAGLPGHGKGFIFYLEHLELTHSPADKPVD